MMDKYIDSPAPQDASLTAESQQHSAVTDLDDRDDIRMNLFSYSSSKGEAVWKQESSFLLRVFHLTFS